MPQPSVLITGCSSGIGRALADAFKAGGYAVWATARKENDLTALEQAGFNAVQLDVNDGQALQQLSARLSEKIGGLDVLINNAGYGAMGPLLDGGVEAMQRQFETNVFSIEVMEVQPGAIASSFGANASQQAEALIREDSPWWPLREGIRARANASQDNPTPANEFAARLLAAVQRDKRPRLLRLGNGSRALPLLATLLPKALLQRVLSKRFGLVQSL